jgi:hypothetical protein
MGYVVFGAGAIGAVVAGIHGEQGVLLLIA